MAEYIDRENYCKNICRCSREKCDKEKCPIWTAPAADVLEELRAAPDEAVRNETALEWLPGLRYAVEKMESSGLY